MPMTALNAKCDAVAALMKTLAHPDRLRILCVLMGNAQTVSEIVLATQMSQSQASQYLNRMKLEGLLQSTKDSTLVRYSIHDPKVIALVQSLSTIFCNSDPEGAF